MPGWMKWGISLLVGFGIIVLGWRLGDNRWLSWLLPAFFVMNCLVLIIVVLLQSGKAADLAGAFGGAGSQTAFGPRGSATLLSKATTISAILFMLTSISLSIVATRSGGGSLPDLKRRPVQSSAPVKSQPVPAIPTPVAPAKK